MSTASLYRHDQPEKAGVLLMNLGTPDEPTASAVRRYLAQFLSDRRVVELTPLIWKPVLHGVILRIRPGPVAKKYASIWMDEGSPLLVYTNQIRQALEAGLQQSGYSDVVVATAMCYGNPSCEAALQQMQKENVRKLLILPLYPQYSATTTAAAFDAVAKQMKSMRWLPQLRFIDHYHNHPAYISALAESVRDHWREHGRPEQLVMSFHGIPEKYFHSGDPYHCECLMTGRLVAEALELKESEYRITFQSRFGREPWLQPYTDHTLEELAQQDVKHVQIICPGFSADCLETLEEIDQENRELFLAAGGEKFSYIPALNATRSHVDCLQKLVLQHTAGWEQFSTNYDARGARGRALASSKRAVAAGAEN